MERGLLTPLKKLRRQVFVEVARVAFETAPGDIMDAIEAIPYKITPGDKPLYRESIWRERAICSERVRLALGLSLRPEDAPVHLTSGLRGSDIADKYYEPPLMQVIPSACAACEPNMYKVTDNCRGCVAHPCTTVCPKGAVSIVNGKSVIDQSKCIKCGKCKAACPYDAIAHRTRPCAEACGVKAIETDDVGPRQDQRGQVRLLRHVHGQLPLRRHRRQVADLAAHPRAASRRQDHRRGRARLRRAVRRKGDARQAEGGAAGDGLCRRVRGRPRRGHGRRIEAEHYAEQVATGKQPFMLTSCCPAWAMLIKRYFPESADKISRTLTPMGRHRAHHQAKVPRRARRVHRAVLGQKVRGLPPHRPQRRRLRRHLRGDVCHVRGQGHRPRDHRKPRRHARRDGRGSRLRGRGRRRRGDRKVHRGVLSGYQSQHSARRGAGRLPQGAAARQVGKLNGALIEGMGCPGGCVAGAGTNIAIGKASNLVKKTVSSSTEAIPPKELAEVRLE